MEAFFRRFAFGCVWFAVFSVGLSAVGGGIAGAMAGSRNLPSGAGFQQGFERGSQSGFVAGVEFRRRYGRYVTLSAALLAVAGTLTGVLPGTRKDKSGS